jgi:hypothetical protein
MAKSASMTCLIQRRSHDNHCVTGILMYYTLKTCILGVDLTVLN